MNNKEENKEENNDKKPLTLKTKLSLNPTLEAPKQLKQSVVSSSKSSNNKTFTVEVKKLKFGNNNLFTSVRSEEESNKNLTTNELSARLNIFKKASQAAKIEEEVIETKNLVPEAPKVLEAPVIEEIIIEKPVEVKPVVKKPSLEEEVEIQKKKTSVSDSKFKKEVGKVAKKVNVYLDESGNDIDIPQRSRSLASIKRARAKEKRKQYGDDQVFEKIRREVILPEFISVGELASRMAERVGDVIKQLMKLDIIANINQLLDAETAELIIECMGHTFKRVAEADIEKILIPDEEDPASLKPRAPVVTIMGHVDHGKTSLLDALKSTDVAAGEAGGITQHIGAYRVVLANGHSITFLDTPGHEAFTAMRSRGADVTDIVVLVVAADDGIKAQTVEAINHAKAANVPIIVAINKIDKNDANPSRIRNELLGYGLVPEELGGETMIVEVSAREKINLDKLEEAIILLAEVMELKANSISLASGVVIEAKMDKNQGALATVLVQRGLLKVGDMILAGKTYGKVKRMLNDKGKNVKEVLPSMPVEIIGLSVAPEAGDKFYVLDNEKQARDIAEYRSKKHRELATAVVKKVNLESLFLKAAGQDKNKVLNIILKADVQGSVEAINASLMKLINPEVSIKILHSGVGAITESDISLAQVSNAVIIGFNVRANSNVQAVASSHGVDIRYYSIIYALIDDIRASLTGMLSPIFREQFLGYVEIRKVYTITKVGKIAGSYVTKGTIKRHSKVRCLRDNIVIFEDTIKALRRFKDDVKEVRENYECGIQLERHDNIQENDILEVYEVIEEAKKFDS